MRIFSKKPFKRNERVADEIRHILGDLFISQLFIPDAGLLTVANVKVTADLKIAKVYISLFENKKPVNDILAYLKNKNNLIRYHIGGNLKLKYTPQLQFYHDDSLIHAEIIENLIKKIHKND